MTHTLTLRRAAKINIGNYENTDVEVTLSVDVQYTSSLTESFKSLSDQVNDLLKMEVDRVELGQVKSKSKAARFGA